MARPDAGLSQYEAERRHGCDAEPEPGAFTGALHCDVCVVGGGLLGVSAAYHLARRGARVVLLEAERLGAGASGRNGGQVIPGFSASPRRLIAIAGAARARAIWHWTRAATDMARALAARHAPAAIHGQGVIAAAATEAEIGALRDDRRAIAEDFGDASLEWLDGDATRARLGTTRYAAGLRDPLAFHLDPLALLEALAAQAMRAGARIATATPAVAVEPGPPWRVYCAHGAVTADAVVLAAQRGTAQLWPDRYGLTLPIWTSMIATAPLSPAQRARILPFGDAVYEVAATIGYWRRTPGHRLLFGAGGSGRATTADAARGRLQRALLRIHPDLAGVRVERSWAGVVDLTLDRLPRFAAPAPGLWIGHGLGGHGVALAVGGGEAIARAMAGDRADFDLIAGLPQPRIPLARLVERVAVPAALSWLRLVQRRG